MKFTKLHGIGNDFILVEAKEKEQDWPALAKIMCDRHFGIGADGLIVLLPSKTADFRNREFNSDGSEAEACGNGLRCTARYIADMGLVSRQAKSISIETMAGIRQARLQRQDGRVVSIEVSMGRPKFAAAEIPVVLAPGNSKLVDIILSDTITVDNTKLLLYFVSMGNPHAIYFQQKPVADFPLLQLGPLVEHHKIFPKRANFEVVNVISRQEIDVRVWERGVGETLACGSGACAVAVAAQLLGYTDKKVTVKLPGGSLNISWDGSGEVLQNGPAEIVYIGEWPD